MSDLSIWPVVGPVATVVAFCFVLVAQAQAMPRACEAALRVAARETGVPESLLRAISLAETGRTVDGAFQPWPWTVNMGGDGQWFPDVTGARLHVEDALIAGRSNIDIGCFQLNMRWHGQAFASLDQMFDPLENARYAARFLAELYQHTGDWLLAAGRYHSRTPALAERYSDRVGELMAGLSSIVNAPVLRTANRFPLLQAGPAGAIGSLVPQSVTGGSMLSSARSALVGG